MKPRVFVACVVIVSGVTFCAATAQTDTAKHEVRIDLDHLPATPAPANPAASSPAVAPAPASQAAAQPTPAMAAAPDQQKPKIEGMEVSRGEKGYLGVKIVNSTFKVTFYDADKNPVPADVSAIALRWPVQYQPNPERDYLTPTADGMALTSSKVVRPPYHFRLFMTLLKGSTPANETVVETFVIDFHQ